MHRLAQKQLPCWNSTSVRSSATNFHAPAQRNRAPPLRYGVAAFVCAGVPPAQTVHITAKLTQEFLQRFPIIYFPSLRKVLRLTLGKTAMVKNNLGSGTLLHKLEFRDRINAWVPAARAPCLDDSFVWHKFDVPSRDISAEE